MDLIKLILITFLLPLSFFITLNSCEQSNNSQDSGSLLIKVTDNPFPVDFVESATVFVNKIELRTNDKSNGNPFIIVAEGLFEFNLLELRNGITTELPVINIPAGSYDLVRLYVESANIEISEVGEFNLKVPSGSETGIKIFINPELLIQGGLTAELLIDFDLSNSFIAQGDISTPAGIKGFNFTPVIRAVNNQLTGCICGTVTNADGAVSGALVSVELESTGDFATAVTDENGYYKIIGLKEESYTVTAEAEGYNTEEVSGIIVNANQDTNVDLVLTK